MVSPDKYSINWSLPEGKDINESRNETDVSDLWTSIKGVVSQEYADFPELSQFCALIEDKMTSAGQDAEAKWACLSLLRDLNDLLWAAEIKRASSIAKKSLRNPSAD